MNKLITYAYMREETDISKQVDNESLDNPIKRAQDRLRTMLGPAFYDQIEGQVITTPKSLSTDNDALFDPYLKEFLAWKAYEIYLAGSKTYFTRTGPREFKEENSEPTSDKTLGEILSLARQDAKIKSDAILSFLATAQRNNTSKYPLYKGCWQQTSTSGFGISAVSKIDTVRFSINDAILNQEPRP